MFKGQITYENLTLRYPCSVAQFLMEEIEKVELGNRPANQDAVYEMLTISLDENFSSEAMA